MVSAVEFKLLFKYEYILGASASGAAKKINSIFGKGTVNIRYVQRWFEKFRTADITVEYKPRPKVLVNNQRLKNIVEKNPEMGVREIAKILNISVATVSRRLTAMGKVKRPEYWVSHNFNYEQKQQRLQWCSSLLAKYHGEESFLGRIIMYDEKWIPYNNRKRTNTWSNIDKISKHEIIPILKDNKVLLSVWGVVPMALYIIHLQNQRNQLQSIHFVNKL